VSRRAPNGFREPPVRKADPSRNLGKERGRPITLADASSYASPACLRCRSRRGYDAKKNQICRCATKGFLLAHPEVIVDRAGKAWWPKGAGQPKYFPVPQEPKGQRTCVCGDNEGDHGGDSQYPGSTACRACGQCIAFEHDPEAARAPA
jgi:hypothetical protein